MLFILVCGVVGAGAALLLLRPYGALVACIGAPFGGSVFAGLAALWVGRRSAAASSDKPLEPPASQASVDSPARHTPN